MEHSKILYSDLDYTLTHHCDHNLSVALPEILRKQMLLNFIV